MVADKSPICIQLGLGIFLEVDVTVLLSFQPQEVPVIGVELFAQRGAARQRVRCRARQSCEDLVLARSARRFVSL